MKCLDTSVGVDHLRGLQPAIELLRGLVEEEQTVVASEVVRFELFAGRTRAMRSLPMGAESGIFEGFVPPFEPD